MTLSWLLWWTEGLGQDPSMALLASLELDLSTQAAFEDDAGGLGNKEAAMTLT